MIVVQGRKGRPAGVALLCSIWCFACMLFVSKAASTMQLMLLQLLPLATLALTLRCSC
jgi:hypothetical protein